MSRSIKSVSIPDELAEYPLFEDFDAALAELKPDAVSINSWPNTHAEYASKAMKAGAHVFMEKPIATTMESATEVAALALATNRKLVLGYILRVHPTWIRFIELGRTLGRPLVMRLSLNQQSNGPTWSWHRALIDSMMPIVDSGVHYVDVMCQLTGARPVRVHGIGAALWAEASRPSYGQLQVVFDDGSVGWFEAGWGPMMSGVAHFVREAIGPKGAVAIVPRPPTDNGKGGAVRDERTTDILQLHHAAVSAEGRSFSHTDEVFELEDSPDHQELCDREQGFFLKAIRDDVDLSDHLDAAVNSLRVVLAAEQSMNEMRVVELA